MAEDHARAVARIVVAQMASELDFEVIQDSALDALVRPACRGTIAASNAAGRNCVTGLWSPALNRRAMLGPRSRTYSSSTLRRSGCSRTTIASTRGATRST